MNFIIHVPTMFGKIVSCKVSGVVGHNNRDTGIGRFNELVVSYIEPIRKPNEMKLVSAYKYRV